MRVVIVPDLAQPLGALLGELSPVEREKAGALPTERRRRQFVFGRIAARIAARRALGPEAGSPLVEVLNGPDGRPSVRVDGATDVVSVSIAHSGRIAVASAWSSARQRGFSAGVDVERLRASEVAESPYAFSPSERAMLAALPHDRQRAGIAAWTVKEAVWKALRADQESGPESIEVRALDLAGRKAVVEVKNRLRDRLGDAGLRIHVSSVQGPDGVYLLSFAEVVPIGWAELSAARGANNVYCEPES